MKPMACIYPVAGLPNAPAHTSINWVNKEGTRMSWKSPKIVEIALGAEINSYACAEAKK